ncbi:stalk domain-containing protein [Peptoniphilus harei]|uniref:stalk domain-containing protein n=1 Tax=Peptoniphilus harei TaxID=54005 RepID=UPI001897B389|nr:stalk domain-containing protein [Peptoniphilus harei]
MNRKMFSLVTSFAILSSSFSPTWAAGKNFTYNNLEKSLAIHAEAKEVKSSEVKEELPLVTETMPDDRVKNKYARIIFVPKTSKVDGVQNYGKLLDKEGKEVLLSDIAYKDSAGKEFIVRGKEYYALKTAKWINILEYKENNKKVLYARKADNNESDPEKKKYHEFLGWKQVTKNVNPFDYGFSSNLSKHSIDNPLVFTSKFQNVPYFYSNNSSPKVDYDGYDFSLKKNDYSRVEFYPVGQESTWAGVLSLKESQKKFYVKDIQNSKYIYLFIRKKTGPYKFGDFKPEPISSENKKFWYWSLGADLSKAVKDDFEIGSKDLDFRAQYIGEYLKIDDNFDLVENPIPEGFYEVNFKPEDGYSSISNFQNAYRKFAVREGCGVGNIINLPESPKLKDTNNNEYTGKTAWYDGFTKIDNIKEVRINSNKVFTARRVRDFESEKFNSVVKEVEVKLNEDVSPEKLKEGITNLPKNVEVEIKTKADTSKVGKTKAVLKITFSDTSVKEVKVLVKVVEKIDGGIVKPIPNIKAEDIMKEEVPYNGKINLLDNINNLPEGAKVEDISKTIDTKKTGTYTGKVKVTFKDRSSRIVEIPVEVLAPLAENFPAQKPEKTLVEKLESLSASEKSEILEKVNKANPQAITVEVSDKGDVTLIYADGSKNVISSEDTIVLKNKESDKKDPEEKPGKEEYNKNPEENKEEPKNKKENKLDSWNEFPRYYVRNHETPTYKVEVKTNSQVSNTKTKVNPKKFVIDIKSGTYTLTEDGKTLEKSMEVKPIIENNRTMLPLRALAEILDAKVIWNDATRTASFTRDGLTALIQIDGSKIVLSNGKTIDLEAKPLNVKGRIYLPLVYVGQVFGLTSGNAGDDKEDDIEWKEESKTVTINIK